MKKREGEIKYDSQIHGLRASDLIIPFTEHCGHLLRVAFEFLSWAWTIVTLQYGHNKVGARSEFHNFLVLSRFTEDVFSPKRAAWGNHLGRLRLWAHLVAAPGHCLPTGSIFWAAVLMPSSRRHSVSARTALMGHNWVSFWAALPLVWWLQPPVSLQRVLLSCRSIFSSVMTVVLMILLAQSNLACGIPLA